ncbi:MAG TPA: AAA family ATPase [Tepidisphaeraceae bacterium]|jgi:predicted ATPase
MLLQALSVSGYRSIRQVHVPLQPINVIVGPNGSGKTNLYRAMYILHEAASGRLAQTLAAEGGMQSVLWAGARRKGPVRLAVGVQFEQYSYRLECGLPPPSQSYFTLDPELKEEQIHLYEGGRKIQLLGRANRSVWARDAEGKRAEYPVELSPSESVLAEIREPHRFPELSMVRQELLRWRFYHHFRTDADSPIRQPQVGVRTPVLSHDGRDLAAAIETILEIGRGDLFGQSLGDAFPGTAVQITHQPQFALSMRFPGFQREFEAPELSDGTLQYLCLLTALLSPRPPALMALNEPETSIHPDLLPALARLIVDASADTQLWITTHSTRLADAICSDSGCLPIQLEKVDGETRIQGQSALERAMTV